MKYFKVNFVLTSFISIIIICVSCNTKNNELSKGMHEHSMDVVNFKVIPFPLSSVALLDGPFKNAVELNQKYLLNYNPDRLLAKFRIEAGLVPKAPTYNGWENVTSPAGGVGGNSLAGHTLGHYLSALSLMYAYSGKQEFLDRVNYIVNELDTCQTANKNGYIGAVEKMKKIFEEELAKGEIRSQSFDLNGLWSPIYTQHKIMAGLRDAYRLCNNQKSLQIESRFADWLGNIFKDLDDDKMQNLLQTEYGGMNETLADLYADTKDKKYLSLAQRFYDKTVLTPILNNRDSLSGFHANTQIPKLIGLAREYELTGDENYKRAASFFWQSVIDHHSYVTGGNGNHEYFGQPDKLRNRLSNETTETCNVYNMLKLSKHLFKWNADAKVADYYERALFNQILSSQHPLDGRLVYNLSLEMGGHKVYEDPEAFTCCIGSGMESQSKYAENIYFHNANELYVSQFIASELIWKEKGLKLTQETLFPNEQSTTIKISVDNPIEFSINLRHPYWLPKNQLVIMVNGEENITNSDPGSFVSIKRTWKTGDIVLMKMTFSLRLASTPDDSDRVAIMYGPLVMAGDFGDINFTEKMNEVPLIMTQDRNPSNWLQKDTVNINSFRTKSVGNPFDFTLVPFYSMYKNRYSVYFDLSTPDKIVKQKENEKALKLRKRELQEEAIDSYLPGDSVSSVKHNFKGQGDYVEKFKERKSRVAARNGYFSFDMRVNNKPVSLVLEYWGGFTGSKTFDILVDDQKIATENISGKRDGEFLDVYYKIPVQFTQNTEKVTIKILPHKGSRGGPIFSVWTINK